LNDDIIVLLKDTLIYKTTQNYSILHILNGDEGAYLASRIELDKLNSLIDTFIKCSNEFKFAANIRSFYEIVILKVSASNVEDQAIEVATPKPTPVVISKPVVEDKVEEKPANISKISAEPQQNVSKVEEKPVVNEVKQQPKPSFIQHEQYVEAKQIPEVAPEDLIHIEENTLIRAIVKSNKELKQQLFAKWSKLNDLLLDPKYNTFVPQLKNATLYSFCNELLIIQTQFKSIIYSINHKDNTEIISEMIEYISGTKVKVYAIDILEARSLLMKYHNLLQVNKLPKLNPEESIYD
jgi:hypothetical protein